MYITEYFYFHGLRMLQLNVQFYLKLKRLTGTCPCAISCWIWPVENKCDVANLCGP